MKIDRTATGATVVVAARLRCQRDGRGMVSAYSVNVDPSEAQFKI